MTDTVTAATADAAVARHERDGSGYAYCDQPHPASDADAKEWCRTYHRPRTPRVMAR